MEKKQYDLCLEILRRFNKAGLLKNTILIGSWCGVFYGKYFYPSKGPNMASLKTRDIDFLIPVPSKITSKINVPALVEDLGFSTILSSSKGYIKLSHPDLILEFLVPEKGAGTDKPFPLPQLGMNAAALRFLTFLSDNTIRVKIEDFILILPHPANFALHKLIITQRRATQDKAIKDRNLAIQVLNALLKKGEPHKILHAFNSVPKKWQSRILAALDEDEDENILTLLS